MVKCHIKENMVLKICFYFLRTVFPWPVYFDALMSLTVIGGTEVTASFKGYVGEAKIYRNKLFMLSQVFKYFYFQVVLTASD